MHEVINLTMTMMLNEVITVMASSSAKVEGHALISVQETEGVLPFSGTTGESSVPLPCGIRGGQKNRKPKPETKKTETETE
jgi:hypothetical protein